MKSYSEVRWRVTNHRILSEPNSANDWLSRRAGDWSYDDPCLTIGLYTDRTGLIGKFTLCKTNTGLSLLSFHPTEIDPLGYC